MKQKDWAIILAAAGMSAIASFVIGNIVISTPTNRHAEVKKLDAISSEFPPPDSKYFNKDSINPTNSVKISPNDNKQPFNP